MQFLNTVNSVKAKVKNVVPSKYHFILDRLYYNSLSIKGVLYQGNQVTCPCCNQSFRQFIPAKPGHKFINNERCPRCDSYRRQRVLWLYLKNKTNLFSERLKVLHIAPEYCFQRNLEKMANLDYVSADLSSPLAQVKMDIINIPFKDNHFDVILCSHVLEHIPDDHQAMKELLRVLKPTGWAILQVPIDINCDTTFEDPTIVSPEDRERFFWQSDHLRLYGLDYKDRLKKAEFLVKVENYVSEFSDDLIEQYGLEPQENIYFCTKSEAMIIV